MTTRRWILVLTIALLACAGHVAYHYLPRARPAAPASGSPVAGLLAAAEFPAAVWVPYPHQNLAHLRQVAGTEPATMKAVARLAGLPSPTVPTFGPLTLPPASEIAVASDDVGTRFVVVAQVYPLVAGFARLAGRLAGNPWLSGGEVVVESQPAEVSWHGDLWMVSSAGLPWQPPAPSAAGGGQVGPAEPGLAWLRIRQAVDPLPAGLYRLWEDAAGIGITSRQSAVTGQAAGADVARGLEDLGLFLLVYAGRHPAFGDPAQALAFFDQHAEKVMEMPRVAALHEPGAGRWDLPGESLLELAGRRPQTAGAGNWAIAALDSTSLEQARQVAPELDAVGERRLRWGLWLDLGGGLNEVDRIARLLGNVPIAPRRQVERWNDARRVLAPLADRYSHLAAAVSDEPRTFDLRLEVVPAE